MIYFRHLVNTGGLTLDSALTEVCGRGLEFFVDPDLPANPFEHTVCNTLGVQNWRLRSEGHGKVPRQRAVDRQAKHSEYPYIRLHSGNGLHPYLRGQHLAILMLKEPLSRFYSIAYREATQNNLPYDEAAVRRMMNDWVWSSVRLTHTEVRCLYDFVGVTERMAEVHDLLSFMLSRPLPPPKEINKLDHTPERFCLPEVETLLRPEIELYKRCNDEMAQISLVPPEKLKPVSFA